MAARNLQSQSGGCEGPKGGNWDGLAPEVLDIIFHHLPVADLLSCSVVSKKWKKSARDVLKRSRECYAYIRDFSKNIQDFNQMIASTEIMEMANGLHIRNKMAPSQNLGFSILLEKKALVRRHHRTDKIHLEIAKRTLEASKQQVQEVLGGQWKYFNLDIERLSMEIFSLEDTLLLMEVILASSDSLQKLVMGQGEDWRFIPSDKVQFPNLKVIHVQSNSLNFCSEETLSKIAPTLKQITGAMMEVRVHAPGNGFMLNRMKSVRLAPIWQLPEGASMNSFLSISGLHRLDLQFYKFNRRDHLHDPDPPEWDDFVFSIVRRNLNTLVELRMFTTKLYKLLSTSDDLRFPNVRKLSLATHRNVSIGNEILALKQMDLVKLCPNLEKVELSKAQCTDHFDEVVNIVEGSEELGQSDMPLRIKLDYCERPYYERSYSHDHLAFLKTIFPKINNVKILGLNVVNACEFSRIFWELDTLEYLKFHNMVRPRDLGGIDALLCGIDFEEYSLLIGEFERMSAAIVPIRPSFFNAKNLKELKITEEVRTGNVRRRNWVIEITENLPDRHVRCLKVKVEGSDGLLRGLNDLRGFTALGAKKIIA